MTIRFAALGIDHGHIFDHIRGLLAADAKFAGYADESTVPAHTKAIARAWPDAPVLTPDQILNDETIQVVCTAAVPADRAEVAIQAMRHGKDVMCDKPG